MKKVLCVGELLIDFMCVDKMPLEKGVNFIKKAGGAPANVSAAISRLGGEASYLGKVGNDSFGKFLRGELERFGVDTTGLASDNEHPTTMAFVSIDESGERDFEFMTGADQNLVPEDIDLSWFDSFEIIHFGSATPYIGGKFEATYDTLIRKAKESGKIISYDPNYRGAFFEGKWDEFRDKVMNHISLSDIVKVSEEELFILTGSSDVREAATLLHDKVVKRVFTTLGSKGVQYSDGINFIMVKAPVISPVDTTGAGDSFIGAMLFELSSLGIHPDEMTDDDWKNAIAFASAVGALTCTKYGAMDALPSYDETISLKNKTYAGTEE